jgi:putative glutamine amidotransferase
MTAPQPIVGLPACARLLNGHWQHATPARYAAAPPGGAGVIPLMIPPIGVAAMPLLDCISGLLLPGSPSNVEPAHYGAPDETPDAHDALRDATSLPLIREALRRGIPVLAICRGIQELNVALGGSLHQRVHLLDGREDHRGQGESRAEQYMPRHTIALSGSLAALFGAPTTTVNSVHGQAIDRLAPGLVIEATAPDGTIEGVRADASSFALGVQWHPEWNYADNPDSMKLFAAFGEACRSYAAGIRRAA